MSIQLSHLDTTILVVALCTMMSCSQLIEPTIELVVPDEFSGPILMIEDPKGIVVKKVNGTYRISLPECGVLQLQSTAFLKASASWKVRRGNGTLIPIDSEARESQTALRFGGWRSWQHPTGRYEHFIGNAREFEAFDFAEHSTPSCNK